MDVFKGVSVIFVFLFLFFIVLTITLEFEKDLISEKEYAEGSHDSIVRVIGIRDELVLLNIVGESVLMEEGEIHTVEGSGIYNGAIKVLEVESDKVLLNKNIEKTYKYYILMSAMSAALTFILTYLVIHLFIGTFKLARLIEKRFSK